ncbi:MAG: pteridine reductase [Candidatus Thiodiazotropha sp. (ex Lucinoma borealis)]|nr:pteridine reductase [Candidatus Thiodiazotropha sp. (ex Lucinoma borealis)]MCU7841522.1 pteridine reductase [Candidatus Thiodiazotropha sp. (ex Troendleina suluensis)]MCU7857353.1 pteridine reductase [Candidatus Thiodiazotropha sp. (ex Lucinoma borealis)]MCU7867226.1 pteridine reductase [Candidatus Thiodiazotropha sp. (ex Lucinoma borealis)]
MTQNRVDLAGKSALITGAAHRIGAAIARQLHAEGMDIVLHYRNSKEAAERLKQALEADRPNSVWLLQADLHQPDSYQHLISEVEAKCSRLDLLVNNASSFYPTPVESASHAQWDDLIGSNLKAPFFLSQAAAPLLRKTEGCIINLVDIHARRPLKNYPIYSVAKAGNAMLVKSLARELGPKVRVNGIAPGVILWPEQGLSEQQRETILDRTALKRAGTPEDIARTLLFLYRDAHYVTGQIIAVDGGRTLQQ